MIGLPRGIALGPEMVKGPTVVVADADGALASETSIPTETKRLAIAIAFRASRLCPPPVALSQIVDMLTLLFSVIILGRLQPLGQIRQPLENIHERFKAAIPIYLKAMGR